MLIMMMMIAFMSLNPLIHMEDQNMTLIFGYLNKKKAPLFGQGLSFLIYMVLMNITKAEWHQ